MFFEDEKDFIDGGSDIHISDDGTVTWEDVLNDSDNDIVSVKSVAGKNVAQSSNKVDLGDEIEIVQDEDDVNDQELAQILKNSERAKQKAATSRTSYAQSASSQDQDEDFDIDKQLANVVLEQNGSKAQNNASFNPRKNEKKQTTSAMPLLLAILVVALVAGGLYYYFMVYAPENMQAQQPEPMPVPTTIQDRMDNTTPEEIAQRTQEPEQEFVQQETEQKPEEQESSIPVVNEEDAKKVKPDQKPALEKKQIIAVTPTGRNNPFMPLQKYVSMEIDETVLDFDKVGIPKPPEQYGQQPEQVVKLMTIAVSGIMYDENKPSAIITLDNNDYFVQEGDKLDDYKIIDIEKNHVIIAYGKNTYKANIGEEFKVSAISGSAEFMSQNQGGGRQYYTARDDKTSSSDNKNQRRYVSEDDVIINAR